MNCLSVNAVLDLFSEELLTPSRRAQVEKHLASCAACRAAAGRLRAPRAPSVAMPAALKGKLRAALAAAPAATTSRLGPDPKTEVAPLIALAVFSLSLVALHALTPAPLSQRPVASDAAPWRMP